jgi:hypothetical protein
LGDSKHSLKADQGNTTLEPVEHITDLELNRVRVGSAESSLPIDEKHAAADDRHQHECPIGFWDFPKPDPSPDQHRNERKNQDKPGAPLGATAELLAHVERSRFFNFCTGALALESKRF